MDDYITIHTFPNRLVPHMFKLLASIIAALCLLSDISIALGAERITVFVGTFNRSIMVTDLEHLINKGSSRGLLRDALKLAKVDEEQVIELLTKKHQFSLKNMVSLTNSSFGKSILKKFEKIIFPRLSRKHGVAALRSALITSVAEDETLQVIELLQNYPTNIGIDIVEAKRLYDDLLDID